jgi:hypothetical protein
MSNNSQEVNKMIVRICVSQEDNDYNDIHSETIKSFEDCEFHFVCEATQQLNKAVILEGIMSDRMMKLNKDAMAAAEILSTGLNLDSMHCSEFNCSDIHIRTKKFGDVLVGIDTIEYHLVRSSSDSDSDEDEDESY